MSIAFPVTGRTTPQLRRRITAINKVIRHCRANPKGLNRILADSLEDELSTIRTELRRRKMPSMEGLRKVATSEGQANG